MHHGSIINTIRHSRCRIALAAWRCRRVWLENVELAGIKELLLLVKGENSQCSANLQHTQTHTLTCNHPVKQRAEVSKLLLLPPTIHGNKTTSNRGMWIFKKCSSQNHLMFIFSYVRFEVWLWKWKSEFDSWNTVKVKVLSASEMLSCFIVCCPGFWCWKRPAEWGRFHFTL